MTPTTPRGWYSTEAALLAAINPDGTRRGPRTFLAWAEAQARWSTTRVISRTASPWGLPFSTWISSASSSIRRAISDL